jgi:SAM-dependent methyltransferase
MVDANGWDASASAWIADMGERGDFSREFILDAPMLARVRALRASSALDIGCGEGRFCRMLRAEGIAAAGVDPTQAFVRHALARDPAGDYRLGAAERLDFPDARFDLVVSYLTLLDIDDVATAIAEMVRVLRPGGSLLIANMTGFASAAVGHGWVRDPNGVPHFEIDEYLTERADWAEWRGIRIKNWHRPLRTYLSYLLAQGLILTHFDEPAPSGGDAVKADLYRRVPLFVVMEWMKPGAS